MDMDDAYSNAAYISDAMLFPRKWREAAAKFRKSHRHAELNIPYGPSERQKLDLFHPNGNSKGLLVFVHGGYWMDFDRTDWSHLAQGANARGWAVAIPSYDLCPNIRISQITQQIARAVKRAADFVDGPIALTGHSAGGHLVARMLDKRVLPPTVGGRLSCVVPISPLSDLRPLLLTSMNEKLNLDQKEAIDESPLLNLDRYDPSIKIWVGGDERPVFLEQAAWLAEAWSVDQVIEKGRHHFDVIDAMLDPESELVSTLVGRL